MAETTKIAPREDSGMPSINNLNHSEPILVYMTTVPVTLLTFCRGQFEFMKKQGLEVIIVSSNEKELSLIADRDQIKTFGLDMARGLSPLADLAALIKLVILFLKIKPTLVNVSTPKAGTLGILAAWLTRVPVKIYTLRGLMAEISDGFSGRLFKTIEWLTCKPSDFVIANSRSVKDYMVSNNLCDPDKIKVIASGSSNGVDAINIFCPSRVSVEERLLVRKQLGVTAEGLIVGFVGRIMPHKGVVELSVAWKQIRVANPDRDIYFLLIGDQDLRDPLPNEIFQDLIKDQRVTNIPWVLHEEMPKYYAVMDLLVLPTYHEGFPNVVLESSAMELPVVATSVAGCVDAVVDGVTGTLVPARNPEALAKAINRYLDDPELRRKHGKAGRQRSLEDFQPQKIWEGLYEEYVRLMKEHGIPSLRKIC